MDDPPKKTHWIRCAYAQTYFNQQLRIFACVTAVFAVRKWLPELLQQDLWRGGHEKSCNPLMNIVSAFRTIHRVTIFQNFASFYIYLTSESNSDRMHSYVQRKNTIFVHLIDFFGIPYREFAAMETKSWTNYNIKNCAPINYKISRKWNIFRSNSINKIGKSKTCWIPVSGIACLKAGTARYHTPTESHFALARDIPRFFTKPVHLSASSLV